MANIVITIPCFVAAGTEVATLSLVSTLRAVGHGVTVCCYGHYDPAMKERVGTCGGQWHSIDAEHEGRISRWQAIRGMWRLFREVRPDCVHVQFVSPATIALGARLMAGVPMGVLNVHTAGAAGYGLKNRLLFRLTAGLATQVVFVSENARRFWMGAQSRPNAHVIHNSVDTERFCDGANRLDRLAERARHGIPADAAVVGIVGRLVEMKGHRDLFAAVKSLQGSHPNVRVMVVGEGPDRARFEAFATELDLAGRVIWTGLVAPEDLTRVYPLFDVLAMPSRWEGFGLAAAEAMAAGVPVVGCRVSGLEEVVEDGVSGLLAPVGDVASLASALGRLLDDRALARQMGAAGQARVERLYGRPVIEAKWQAFYAGLGLG